MALQVTEVLSEPRAVAGHRHLELFVLMSNFGRSDDHRDERKWPKSHPSPTIVGSTSRHLISFFYRCYRGQLERGRLVFAYTSKFISVFGAHELTEGPWAGSRQRLAPLTAVLFMF